MSESSGQFHAQPTSAVSHSPIHLTASPRSPLVQIGGGLGIAATVIGFAVFVGGCFGYTAAFKFAPVPLTLAGVGLLLTLVGGFKRKTPVEDISPLAALMINTAGVVGSLLLMAVKHGWLIFAGGAM